MDGNALKMAASLQSPFSVSGESAQAAESPAASAVTSVV